MQSIATLSTPNSIPRLGLIYLLLIYLIWGSTFFFIKIAVGYENGFPPFFLAGLRNSMAGVLLLGWTLQRGYSLKVTWREFVLLAILGILFWTVGNGFVTFAEKNIDSGFAAVIFGTVPIWMGIMDAVASRTLPSRSLLAALFIGFAGICVLTLPQMQRIEVDLLSIVALFTAAVGWAFATFLQKKLFSVVYQPKISGYQLLIGGSLLMCLSKASGETLTWVATSSLSALVYLVLVGSVLGFSVYCAALKILPTVLVGTFGYVTPAIAILLGSVVLGENLSYLMLVGSLLILTSIFLIFRIKGQVPAGPRR